MRGLLDRYQRGARCRRRYEKCPHSERHWHPSDRHGVRWDIQGLRAFAVVVVILDHMWQWPSGGFVGVDVFFVISGFLITGLLLREHDKTGRISFVGFYRRRVKRIMPAAVLVLVVGMVWSQFVFAGSRWHQTFVDAIWALFFGANWRFQSLATDYFNAGGPQSPFQHYWSLSIEEQFYFVWPWLMLFMFAVLLRNRASGHARAVVLGTIATITAGSFAYAMSLTATNPTSAYFSTFARIWELGLGATLAVAAPHVARIPERLRPLLAWIGVVGLVTSLFVISDEVTFPAPWAALPVFSAGLVIAAGTFTDRRRQQRFLWPLTNVGSGYVGDLSYSLYLWHFPVIVIGTAQFGDGPWDKAAFAVAIAVIAYFSYELVENPLRRTEWLVPPKYRDTLIFDASYGNKALAGLVVMPRHVGRGPATRRPES